MAVLGGREEKKKIESNNHLVVAFPTRRYNNRLQDLQPDQGFPPPSSQSFPATQRWSKKLVPTKRTRRAEKRQSESSATKKQSPD